jgi:hypothetical protein
MAKKQQVGELGAAATGSQSTITGSQSMITGLNSISTNTYLFQMYIIAQIPAILSLKPRPIQFTGLVLNAKEIIKSDRARSTQESCHVNVERTKSITGIKEVALSLRQIILTTDLNLSIIAYISF